MMTAHTHKTITEPYDIRYFAQKTDGERSAVTVERVIFDRFNEAAGIREQVSIHWTEAFKWADADPCGGMGISGVKLTNGREAFASGRWYNDDTGGLAEVVVNPYGSPWLIRERK